MAESAHVTGCAVALLSTAAAATALSNADKTPPLSNDSAPQVMPGSATVACMVATWVAARTPRPTPRPMAMAATKSKKMAATASFLCHGFQVVARQPALSAASCGCAAGSGLG